MNDDLAAYMKKHGARVRRKEAMTLLCIRDKKTFKKVVDANPDLKHKLDGEEQFKYRTDIIFNLLGAARCATEGRKTQ